MHQCVCDSSNCRELLVDCSSGIESKIFTWFNEGDIIPYFEMNNTILISVCTCEIHWCPKSYVCECNTQQSLNYVHIFMKDPALLNTCMQVANRYFCMTCNDLWQSIYCLCFECRAFRWYIWYFIQAIMAIARTNFKMKEGEKKSLTLMSIESLCISFAKGRQKCQKLGVTSI